MVQMQKEAKADRQKKRKKPGFRLLAKFLRKSSVVKSKLTFFTTSDTRAIIVLVRRIIKKASSPGSGKKQRQMNENKAYLSVEDAAESTSDVRAAADDVSVCVSLLEA